MSVVTSQPHVQHAIAALAAVQHGAVRFDQLRGLGLSSSSVQRMTATGKLHTRHRGTYAVGHPRLSRKGRWMAAVLTGGDGAVLSHVSAAQHWGITRRKTARIDVSTPRHRCSISRVRVHLLRPLQGDTDVTVHDSIPITTVGRTIVDLAEVMTEEELAFVMHEAAHWNLLDVADVEATIAAHPRFRGRGVLRRALASHLAGHTGARSRLELRVGRYLDTMGIPRGNSGAHIATPTGTYEVDRAWFDTRIYLEIDGFGHRRASTRRQDYERDAALRSAGWTGFRIDGDAFTADPAAATADLRAAFR